MADETIIIQYIVEVDTAIQNAQRMREVINQSKEDIKRMVAESGASFKDIGKSLVESFKSLEFGTEGAKKIGDFLKIDPETLQQQNEFTRARQEAIGIIRTATQELGQEERTQAAESVRLAQATAKAIRDAKSSEQQAASEYERVTKQGYGVMSAAAQAYGQQVAQVKQQIVTQSQTSGQTYQQTAQQMQAAGTSAKVLNSALKELSKTQKDTEASSHTLGSTLRDVFVIGLGINVYNAIRQVISGMEELIKKGQDVAESFFLLETGVRALRRAGVDVTSSDLLDNLQRLNEETGNFYTQLELVKGAAAFANLIRDMGLTEDQIYDLQKSIITLSIVNGRSMEEVQRTVALALSSGYTEGLQRLGLSINRVNIAARANEMGWKGGYTALTEYQRGQAELSLIMEKTAKYSDDLNAAQLRLFGGIKGTQTEIENTKNAIGEQLLPIWLILLKAVNLLIDLLARIPFVQVISGITGIVQAIQVLPRVWEAATKSTDNFLERLQIVIQYFGKVVEAISKLKPLNEVFSDFAGFGQAEIPVGEPNRGQDEEGNADKKKDLLKKLHDDIEQEQRRFNNRMAELERDLDRDMRAIDRDLTRDLQDIWRDYQRDRGDIIEDGNRKIADAEEEGARKAAEEARKYAIRIDEENRKYQESELEAERKHQEDMRRLREEFLFDLEDALHERDARQILQLTRRYNLDKAQGQRQFELDQEERAKQHQLELEELAREHAERMRQLAEEQAEKIAQIREETQLRLEERQRDWEREKEDRNRKAEEDKQDRRNKQTELIDELKIQSNERIAELIAELSEEKDMTAEMLQSIADEYTKTYGPNGVIDQQMYYFVRMLAQRAAEANAIIQQLNRPNPYQNWNNNNGGSGRRQNAFAEGGIMYADRPTTVVFGEKGLEKAEFTPVSRTGMNEGKVVSGGELVGNGGGRITLAVAMEAGLVASIQENTLDKAADILFEVQRNH